MRMRSAVIAGTIFTAGFAPLLTGTAQADVPVWSVLTAVTPPLTNALNAVLVTTPTGIVEEYNRDGALVVRRHQHGTWGPTYVVDPNQAAHDVDDAVVAATDSTIYTISQHGTFHAETLFLEVQAGTDAASAPIPLGAGSNPAIRNLPGGGVFITAESADEQGVNAWTYSSTGVLSAATQIAHGVNYGGASDAIALIDKDGHPLAVYLQCPTTVCTATSAKDLRTRTLVGGVWGDVQTVTTGIKPLFLEGADGDGKVLLSWFDTTQPDPYKAPHDIINEAGAWGAVDNPPGGGEPLIGADGTQVLADAYGDSISRPSSATAWTVQPDGPKSPAYCDGGDIPTLEDNVLVISQSVKDSATATTCHLIETRHTIGTATYSAAYPTQDTTAPVVGKPAVTTPSATATPTVTFTTDDPTSSASCSIDGGALAACVSPYVTPALADGSHTVFVTAVDGAGSWGTSASTTFSTDTTGPTASIVTPTSSVTTTPTAAFSWTGTDGTGTGVATYDVRYRKAAYNGAFSDYVSPAALQATDTTSSTLAVAVGAEYCFSVRATDKAGHTGAYSAERCTGTPLDDRNLYPSTGWTKLTGAAFSKSTALRATTGYLTKPGVQASHFTLLATTCPSCGTASFSYNGHTVTVDLHATTTKTSTAIELKRFPIGNGPIKVTVTSKGKPVVVDGLVASRT